MLEFFLITCLGYLTLCNSDKPGVVSRDGGGFEVLDWDEYERGSRTVIFVLNIHENSNECFYEHLLEDSKIFLSFEVVTGSSLVLDYSFEHEKGIFVSKYGISRDTLEVSINETSEWKFCFNNIFKEDRQLYVFGTFYHPYSIGPTKEERNQTKNAKSDLLDKSRNIMYTLEKIEQQALRLQQLNSRTHSHEIADSIEKENTQRYILKWAMFQIIIIVAVGIGQVYFIRYWFNVFDSESSTLSSIFN